MLCFGAKCLSWAAGENPLAALSQQLVPQEDKWMWDVGRTVKLHPDAAHYREGIPLFAFDPLQEQANAEGVTVYGLLGTQEDAGLGVIRG